MFEHLSNTLTNRQLYKKAYLIEFYASDSVTPDEVFTFSVPPESEELTYSQRKTETKTFGGLHIDDYGIDAVKILLSGSTINQSLKRIYRAGKGDDWLSGEGEIYHFRDLIQRYKNIGALQNSPHAKIIIYDLSKFTTSRSRIIDNYWQAFLGDFKIRRSNDKPFTYKYSLEFTGIIPDYFNPNVLSSFPKLDVKNLNIIEKAMEALKTFLGWVKTAEKWWDDNIVGGLNDVLSYVHQTQELINLLGDVLSYSTDSVLKYLNSIGNMAENILDSATGIIDAGSTVIDSAKALFSLPRTIQLRALNIGLEILNATKRLLSSTENITTKCRNIFSDLDDFSIPDNILEQYDMNILEMDGIIESILNDAENAANELVAAAKSSNIPEVIIGSMNPETGEPRIVLSYGYTEVILRDVDSLESLANRYMGDPDRAIDIAMYNGVASLSDLNPGDSIKIPITSRTTRMKNNLIFARREDRDNYGRDIMLTDQGNIVESNTGDYELTSGVQNLSQAILLRLRESNAKRIRINTYGLRKSVSDPIAGVVYIISSIKLTVNNDPRVASVDNVTFSGRGDSLDVNVFYHDINNSNAITSGRV